MLKNIVIFVFLLMVGFIFINATYKTAGGHPSSTGAPNEQTCARAGCHLDATIAENSPLTVLKFSNTQNTYNLNGYYSLSLEINLDKIDKFGFEIVAIDSATEKNVGQWFLTDTKRTHIIDGESPVTDRKYITHTAAGTAAVSDGKGQWGFKWKAPSTDKGTIMFYAVCSATNHNDNQDGEQLFFLNYKIRYSANSTGLSKALQPKPSVILNNKKLIVQANNHLIKSFKLITLDGKTLYENYTIRNEEEIDMNEIKAGGSSIFLYQIQTESDLIIGKIWNHLIM